MLEKKKFTVLNDKGIPVECEPLFTFESDETKKQYIVYTDSLYAISDERLKYISSSLHDEIYD